MFRVFGGVLSPELLQLNVLELNMDTSLMELSPLASTKLQPSVDVPSGAEEFVPEKVCAKMIHFVVEDNKLMHVNFSGGCEGNLKAISKLLKGMEVSEVIEKLDGISCGKKDTSCTDQLCIALREHTS